MDREQALEELAEICKERHKLDYIEYGDWHERFLNEEIDWLTLFVSVRGINETYRFSNGEWFLEKENTLELVRRSDGGQDEKGN